jgi:hypothetical protein
MIYILFISGLRRRVKMAGWIQKLNRIFKNTLLMKRVIWTM